MDNFILVCAIIMKNLVTHVPEIEMDWILEVFYTSYSVFILLIFYGLYFFFPKFYNLKIPIKFADFVQSKPKSYIRTIFKEAINSIGCEFLDNLIVCAGLSSKLITKNGLTTPNPFSVQR